MNNNRHTFLGGEQDTAACGRCGLESCYWDEIPCLVYTVTVILKGGAVCAPHQFSSMFAAEYFLEEVVAGDYYDREEMSRVLLQDDGIVLRERWFTTAILRK